MSLLGGWMSALNGKPRLVLVVLFFMQILAIALVFPEFLSGRKYLAFFDIGSDTIAWYVPIAMHMADYWREVGFPGWSMSMGLGAPMFAFWDPFAWPYILAGSSEVLGLRIWVHLAKLILAGWVFFLLLRKIRIELNAALILSFVYSFCGYALINSQWDQFGAELVFYPLLLWAVLDRMDNASSRWLIFLIPLAVASGVFFFNVAVFFVWIFIAQVIACGNLFETLKKWLLNLTPAVVLGFLLAAPILFPYFYQLADSPRVVSDSGGFLNKMREVAVLPTASQWLSLIAGFYHKDLLHVGNAYAGWFNYLEAPGFYVGMLSLLIVPQLWAGGASQRRVLVFGIGFLAVYIMFPFIAYSAYAFMVDYYRVSNLWVSILLLLLAAQALDQVLRNGIDQRMLAVGVAWAMLVPVGLWLFAGDSVWAAHLVRILALSGAYLGLLLLADLRRWHAEDSSPLTAGLLVLVFCEAVFIGRPSFHHDRVAATPSGRSYINSTGQLISDLRIEDSGFYRIEKIAAQVSLNDALAQGYFGVASYYTLNPGSAIRLYKALGLLPETGMGNYTNWLPGPAEKFPLYALFGVRYIISEHDPQWPGFVVDRRSDDLLVLRNEKALPLAVAHDRQIALADFLAAPVVMRNFAMLHGVVIDELSPELDTISMASLGEPILARLDELYLRPADVLLSRGMSEEYVSHNLISGRIRLKRPAVLVFSVPFAKGWEASVNGVEARLFSANVGMLALMLPVGEHRIELVYRTPGQSAGFWVGGFALLLIFSIKFWRRVSSATS